MWSYLASFLSVLLQSLGLSRTKKGTLLLLGLDNAGKTTLLHRIRTGSLRTFPPTDRPRLETFTVEGITFKAWDLGGHEAVRHLWEDYVGGGDVGDGNGISAVLFLIDSSDYKRFDEAEEELDALVNDGALGTAPLAILLNKCDLEGARPSVDVAQAIQYGELARRHGESRVAMFRCSVLRGEGYQDAFKWIADFL